MNVTFVKGDGVVPDRTWMTFEDGSTDLVAVHVWHDLPHLVAESAFDLPNGLWGVLARGGFSDANRAVRSLKPAGQGHPEGTRPAGRSLKPAGRGRGGPKVRLVTDAPFDDLAAAHWLDHRVAKAATNAVVNHGGDGPDDAAGVRERMRRFAGLEPAGRLAADEEFRRELEQLADRVDDASIERAIRGVRALLTRWSRTPAGESLRLQWPLEDAFLDSLK